MVEPISAGVVATAPLWLPLLKETLLSKGKEAALDEGKKWILAGLTKWWTKWQEKRHLKKVLKNAAQKGVNEFTEPKEREEYRTVLAILSEPGSHSEALRQESLKLFTLYQSPNLKELADSYETSLRTRTLSQPEAPKPADAARYLYAFFTALKDELFKDKVL
jgi:hypothetical protein